MDLVKVKSERLHSADFQGSESRGSRYVAGSSSPLDTCETRLLN